MNIFDKDKCRRRNRLTAARGVVEGLPIRFLQNAASGRKTFVTESGALPANDAEAIEAINARLPEGAQALSLSQVFIRYLEAASNSFIADRFAFFSTSTLVNIATGAEKGVAFMNSHRTGSISTPAELPFGKTFAGRYEAFLGPDGNVVERAVLGIYMLRGISPNGEAGPTTDDMDRMIKGGTLFDVSVGLYPGRNGKAICNVCGENYRTCKHSAGTNREMSAEQQLEAEDRGVPGGLASYTIDNYELNEVSGVYDGAVPGAGFSKGLAMLGEFSEEERAQFRAAFLELLNETDSPSPALPPAGAEGRGASNTTISTGQPSGGTGEGTDTGEPFPGGAGMNQPQRGTGETTSMKNLLVRALSAFGLGRMATAVITTTAEDPESLASVMAGQVEAEVAERVKNHPLMLACEANGIKTTTQLATVLEMSTLGEVHLAELRAEAQAEATRAYGGELGRQISAQVGSLPAASVKTMLTAWRTEADAKFGIGADGSSPRRVTAPAAGVTVAADVEDKTKLRPWERLTDTQRATGLQMGFKTAAKQDAFAQEYLKEGN